MPTRALLFTSVAFALWGALALGWTPNTGRGGRQLAGALINILGCWVAIGLAGRHRAGLTALRNGFVTAALGLSLVGVWQYVTGRNLWTVVGQPFDFAGNPLIGTFINPNNFAAFLLGCLGPIIAIMVGGRLKHRLLGIFLIILLAWVLANTASRTGVLGLAIICVAACVIVGIKLPRSQGPIAVGVLAILTTAAFNYERIRAILGGVSIGTEASDDLRLQLSKIAFRYFFDSWGLGIGPAGFEVKLESDASAQVIRVLPPHNTFLEIAAEYGLPVLLPFMLLIVGLGAAAVRRHPGTSQASTSQQVELLACFVAIVAGGLVASSLIADPSWWLLIGYAILLARRGQDDVGLRELQSDETRRDSRRSALAASVRTQSNQPATKTNARATS